MNYSAIEYNSVVDGEGIRVSLFVSGCRNHCKGCFNEETWDFDYGKPFTAIEENEMIEAGKIPYISGWSLMGGDPMEPENQRGLIKLIRRFHEELPNKTLWLYTGYILEKDLLPGQRNFIPNVTEYILSHIDVLVDGPFLLNKRDLSLAFRGSSNQRILNKRDILMIMHKATPTKGDSLAI